MTEQFQEVESRIISGLGILQIPIEARWRYFRVYVRLIRDPVPDFQNKKWNPDRSEYCKITWVSEGYVWKEDVLNYEQEVFELPAKEPAGYLASPLACLFTAVLEKLDVIIVALGGSISPVGDPIPIEPVKLITTQLQFSCRDGCAIQVVLQGLEEDVGCPEGEPSPKQGDKPDNELPKVPPGTGVGVSPPYNEPDDDGNTIPDEGDEFDPPGEFPVGEECEELEVTILWETAIDPPGNLVVKQYYGVINSVVLVVDATSARVLIDSRGEVGSPFCQPANQVDTFISLTDPTQFINYELISIVPVSP